jgi:phosphoribosyl-ATP pyrophosphohydrolase
MVINELFTTILSRRGAALETSYTARLFAAGEDEVIKKVGEEAIEVILAAKGQGNTRLVEEVADLTYHILVLLAERGLSPADVETELAKRRK